MPYYPQFHYSKYIQKECPSFNHSKQPDSLIKLKPLYATVDMECLGVNTYTDGPEDDENLDEEEGEKEDSDFDYSLIIY